MKVIVKARELARRLQSTRTGSEPTLWYRGEFFQLGQGAMSVRMIDGYLAELDLAPLSRLPDLRAVVRITPDMVEQPGPYFVNGKAVVR